MTLDILLVEDNEGDVEMARRALREADCALAVAHDGVAALDLLRKGEARPRIILLDLNMPRMDGRRFLEAVKQDAALKAIPVVMLTSSKSPADIRDCYERHASCYVVKPFGSSQFADTLRQVVRFWSGIGQLP
jgi:two-component system, chemotaxis family, response regulator Rcp1